MTREQTLALLPNASESTIRRNLDSGSAHPVQNPQPKPPVLDEPARADAGQESRPTRVKVRIISYRCRLLDIDNLAGGSKFLIDAIRYQGLIRDDSPDAIELSVSQIRVSKRDLEETVVILERLPEISANEAAALYSKIHHEVNHSNI